MSVQSQIDRIEQNVANTYAVLAGLGADMPAEQNSDNLARTAGTAKAVLYSAQTLTEAQKTQARQNIGAVSKDGLSLGIHTDGLVYLFVDGVPVGTGIEMSAGGDVVGYVDENNNIVLSGALADGTYTVKYEMEDGTLLDIGELSTVVDTTPVNQIPLSIESDGSAYNGGLGYKTGYRIRSSGEESALASHSCTGFIPAKTGDKLYMDGLYLNDASGNTRIALYDANKAMLTTDIYPNSDGGYVSEGNGIYSHTITMDNVAFVRFSIAAIMDGTEIVTVNQPIK